MIPVGKGRLLIISVYCQNDRAKVEAKEMGLHGPSVMRNDIPNDLQWLEDHVEIRAKIEDYHEYRQYRIVVDGKHEAFLLISPECHEWTPRLTWVTGEEIA